MNLSLLVLLRLRSTAHPKGSSDAPVGEIGENRQRDPQIVNDVGSVELLRQIHEFKWICGADTGSTTAGVWF